MRRVLVIGGAGFIGAHLVRALAMDGVEVDAADLRRPIFGSYATYLWRDLPDLGFTRLDVTDQWAVQRAIRSGNYGTVFLLSSVGDAEHLQTHPAMTERVIVGGLLNVLGASKASDVDRVVIASSEAVYAPPVPPILSEGHRTDWTEAAPYWYFGVAKAAAEGFAAAFAALEGLTVVAIRFSGVYGLGMSYDMGLGEAVPAVVRGQHMKSVRGGNFRRVWTHVGDAVNALSLADQFTPVRPLEVFHVDSEEQMRTTEEVLELVQSIVCKVHPSPLGSI